MRAPDRGWLTAFAGALVGAALGGWLLRPGADPPRPEALAPVGRPAEPPESVPPSPAPEVRCAQAPARVALDAEERKAIAVEVARVLRAAPAAPEPERAPPAAAPEAPRARAEANQIVERALSARVWTEQDVVALRLLLPKLAAADQEAVMSALIQAINAGQLQVRFRGPPI